MVKITEIKTFLTRPFNNNLVVVKIETNQPGLNGLGCATFTQRCKAVVTIIEEYLRPLLVGREVDDIQDLWTLMYQNAYWRNGPLLNTAIGGIDLALWDIKGKMAGMPVYQLLGGKCREAVAVYMYANGTSLQDVIEKAQAHWENGFNYIRLQYDPLKSFSMDWLTSDQKSEGTKSGNYLDSRKYAKETVRLFEEARKAMGSEPYFVHDVHERILPTDALYLAKALEDLEPFFIEDLFSPENRDYYRQVKNTCRTPIAMGELFTNQLEWIPLVTERLIDYIRIHITMIGGLTPALRCAHMCELHGVRLAWHAPYDLNPVGHAAQMHLDLISPNFGVQEWSGMNDIETAMFPGCPVISKGYAYVNDKPGFGIEFDERLAKKYPATDEVTLWTEYRHTDGSLYTP